MGDTVRLGRVGGVRIGAHWSLLAVMVLLGASLAHERLPLQAPGLGAAAYGLAGAATAIGLVLGVLAHEAGHAVVARRFGLVVDGITLSWVGGVTRIEGETRSPARQVAVAGVGPAVSAAVGGALLALRALAGHGGAGAAPGSVWSLVLASVGWLGVINVGLAAFNLVPASPLDGGRILHGALWRLSGDRRWATRWTSRLGVGFGLIVAGAGLVRLTGRGNAVDAVVLCVLGVWLAGAARSEGLPDVAQWALAGARVSDVMRPVGAAPGWLSLDEFAETFGTTRPGWAWLLEGAQGTFEGVVAGDAACAVPAWQRRGLRAIDVAVPVRDTVGAAPADDALDCMVTCAGRVVVVVEGGHTVGVVVPADVEALVASGRQVIPAGHPRATPTGR
jgi:Zn-dependent protease